MNPEMAMLRVVRALGCAGYSQDECDEITAELFGIPTRLPPPGAAEMTVRIICGTCGPIETFVIQPGMTLGRINAWRSCHCHDRELPRGYNGVDRAEIQRRSWRAEFYWKVPE